MKSKREAKNVDKLGIRRTEVFWRGEVNWDTNDQVAYYKRHEECLNEDGRLARLEAVSLSINPKHLWKSSVIGTVYLISIHLVYALVPTRINSGSKVSEK
mmetsp:Transcript_9183/g.12724  ORF Transcript_9183/g.12724 Transcript_9183/m.12724 type:complete len:100 (+) Transcript_9183:791-1090(+)